MSHPYRRRSVWDWMHRNDILLAYICIVLTIIAVVQVTNSLKGSS